MITVFTATDCEPCQAVKEFIKEGKVDPNDIELIDIETDEGFAKFTEVVLSKGDGAVPSAYKNGKECRIVVEDDVLKFICGELTPQPPAQSPSSSPSPADA